MAEPDWQAQGKMLEQLDKMPKDQWLALMHWAKKGMAETGGAMLVEALARRAKVIKNEYPNTSDECEEVGKLLNELGLRIMLADDLPAEQEVKGGEV